VKLVVSIHDVTPAHEGAVLRLWEMCRVRSIVPALLVVPNWHGEHPLDAHDPFVGWCRTAASLGADVFLHGGRHDEIGSARRWRDELRAFGRTNREGEFLTLDRYVARRRIDEGVATLRRVGLAPMGFIAPAWLARDECRDAITEAGLRVSEDDRAIYLHRRGQRIASPVVRWSARSSWRAQSSAMVAHAVALRHERHPLVRIALHPQDLAHPVTEASVQHALDHWSTARSSCGYSALEQVITASGSSPISPNSLC
jgi:hypothetical protein